MLSVVSLEVSTLICIIGFSMTALFVIITLLSKQLCHQSNNACWCCQKSSVKKRRKISKELVSAFFHEEDLESSDCEESLIKRLQHPAALSGNYQNNEDSSSNIVFGNVECNPNHNDYSRSVTDCDKTNFKIDEMDETLSQQLEDDGNKKKLFKNNNRPSLQKQMSIMSDVSSNYDHHCLLKNRSKNMLKQQAFYTSLALKNNSKALESMLLNNSQNNVINNHQEKKLVQNDLISLAEKGRIGKQTSTEGSISSDGGSATDPNLVNNSRNKKNFFKHFKTASSETESKEVDQKYQVLNNFYDHYESDTQSSNLPDFSPNTTLSESNIDPLLMKSGNLEISFAYDAPTKRLCVTVIQARDIPYKEPQIGVFHQVYVKVILLTMKKQKFKTKPKPIFCPIFDETFSFTRVNSDEILKAGLRFKLYSVGFAKKTHLMSEARLQFKFMKPQQQEIKLWLALESLKKKRHNRLETQSDVSSLAQTDDSTSSQSFTSQTMSPELMCGLSYNGTTGLLSVTIVKGSQFRSISTRTPDTFIKLSLISQNCQELACRKTKVCREQPNPVFKESFVFQVALFQLSEVTLVLSAYNKRSIKKKELIGWISIGYNSSGDEELSHWNDMRDNKGEKVTRWHVLHEP